MIRSEDIEEFHLYKPKTHDFFIQEKKAVQRFIFSVHPSQYTQYEYEKLRKLKKSIFEKIAEIEKEANFEENEELEVLRMLNL